MPQKVAIIGATVPEYELYCPNWAGMRDGLDRLGIEYVFFSCRPNLDVDSLIDYNPDLVIYGLLDMARKWSQRSVIRHRLPKAKIVFWYGDYRDTSTGQIETDMSEIDMMFVSNDAQSGYYEKRWNVPSCHYLPLGSPIYTPEYNPRFDFDFVFIGGLITGSSFMERARTMWRYKEEYGLKIIDGPGNRPDLRAQVFKNMPTIYRSSKIVLDQSHFTDVLRYTSNRHWIVTASGGFALTKRFPGCEEAYPEGTRVYYKTFEESIKLRDYYLENPKEREQIRLAGYEHAKNHTYDHRFARMFELLY